MLIHLLFSISYSVQRFCLCQPDRLADSCSLEKKCHRYFSQSDIILYNPKTNFTNNLFSNFNSSQITAKNEQGAKNSNVIFEVFGSQTGNKRNSPISINMLDEMFSNIEKLTFYGGEFNQVVRIQNINSRNISFEVQNMQIIFEDARQLIFNKLSLRNSVLKFENSSSNNQNTKLTVEAQEVVGDSSSLSSNYFSIIKTEKLQVTDKMEMKNDLSNNFGITAPVKIADFNPQKLHFEQKKKKKILEDQSDSYDRIRNYFCIATQARLSRAKDLLECDAYSVPSQNYYSAKDSDLLNIISNSPNNTNLRFYITLSTETDPIRINFPVIENKNITISIISADVDVETRVEIKGRTSSSGRDYILSQKSTLSISKIDYCLIDSTYLQSFLNVELYQSPIYISDSAGDTVIYNLITDAVSLSQFTGTNLTALKNFQLSRAIPVTLQGKVFLGEGCMCNVTQYAAFPITRLNYDDTIKTFYLTLSDSIEDQRLDLYFENDICVNFSEATSINTPSLTFAGGKTITNENKDVLQNCPYLNITITVSEKGLNLFYGTENVREFAFPNSSYFTINYNGKAQPDLNLTINDYRSIEHISQMFYLAFVGPFKLNVMTPDTIVAFLNGINQGYKMDECLRNIFNNITNETRPSFLDREKCYQIGGYNLSLVNLDVQSSLTGITYDDSAVLVGLSGHDALEKFPSIFEKIEITTNTNDMINFSINVEKTNASKISKLQLNLEGSPTLFFNETYNETFNETYNPDKRKYFEIKEAMEKLFINHGSNDLLLIGDHIPVPEIIISDPIKGVLYESDGIQFPISVVDSNTFKNNNTRYGPRIEVSINSDVNFPQEDFLAEEVIFKGESEIRRLNFYYGNPSRSNYTFENINLNFVSANSNKVDFKGKFLKLINNAQIKQQSSLLTIDVDEFFTDSIISVPAISVSSPVLINKSFTVNLDQGSNSRLLSNTDTIKQIIFGDDSVTFVNEKGEKSANFQTADPSTQTNINTNQESEIQLSVEDGAETVPSNVNLNFNGNEANLNFDKSWSGVDVPSSFVTNFQNIPADKVHLSTEMMSIPPVNITGVDKNAIETTTHKRKLTKDLAFWIFIGITALVFVITLILCIVGLTCCKYVEQLDVSSSAEGQSDIAIGEIDGLPPNQAEIKERTKDKARIKEERIKAIEDRNKAIEKRKKKIAEGKISEEEDIDDEEEGRYEDQYVDFDDDDIYHNRSSTVAQPTPPPKKKKQPKKKKDSETSEEFKAARKKAQLNTASGAAPAPAPPPPPRKPAESDDDAASYNQTDSQDEFSEVSVEDNSKNEN